MNIIKWIRKILRSFVKKILMPKIKKPKRIILATTDAAIVLRYHGCEFMYPEIDSGAPQELLDTLDYLKYAIERKDWHAKWADDKAWNQAIEDLTKPPEEPKLKLIKGGLKEKEE